MNICAAAITNHISKNHISSLRVVNCEHPLRAGDVLDRRASARKRIPTQETWTSQRRVFTRPCLDNAYLSTARMRGERLSGSALSLTVPASAIVAVNRPSIFRRDGARSICMACTVESWPSAQPSSVTLSRSSTSSATVAAPRQLWCCCEAASSVASPSRSLAIASSMSMRDRSALSTPEVSATLARSSRSKRDFARNDKMLLE
eukprot:1522875-Pleurochrysis_carterae.AAC.1